MGEGEEVESFLLDGCGPCGDGERHAGRGGDFDAVLGEGGEIGDGHTKQASQRDCGELIHPAQIAPK